MDQEQINLAQQYLWWFRQTYGGYPSLISTPSRDQTVYLYPTPPSSSQQKVFSQTEIGEQSDWFEQLIGDHHIQITLPPDELQLVRQVTVYNLSVIPDLTVDVDYDEEIATLTKGKKHITLSLEPDDEDRATELTKFLAQTVPHLFAQFQDGDGIILSDSLERNDGYYLFYHGELLDLVTEDGFHDYGLPPRVVRPYYALTWLDYGFLGDLWRRQNGLSQTSIRRQLPTDDDDDETTDDEEDLDVDN